MVSGLLVNVRRGCGLLALAVMLTILAYPAAAAVVSKINWISAVKGIEYAQLPLLTFGKQWGSIVAVRIDPAVVMFRVYYHEGKRKTIPQCAADLPGAARILNATDFP